jgi:hypothetical protein
MTKVAYQPRVIRRSSVLPARYSDGDLRRARRSGAIVVLAPGVYVSSADLPDFGPLEWHLATVGAAVAGLTGQPVVSHLSAAVLHGLHPAGIELLPVHVTRRPPAKSRRGGRIVAHRAELVADDIATIAGVPVTTVVRTALDCTFLLPAPAASDLLVAGIEAGRFSAGDLLSRLPAYRRVPGVRQVAETVRDAGARASSGYSPTVISTWAGSAIGPADTQP